MNVTTNNQAKCTQALTGLKNVIDPEVGLNIVDLGLIYELDFNNLDQKVTCIMTLTTEFCPMGESIVDNTTQTLQTIFPESSVAVNLLFQPPWSWDMISEEGRRFLGR